MINELYNTVAVGKVVDRKSLSEHVFSYTAHLYCIGRKESTSVHERVTFESDWVVSFVHDQHSDESFITIHDEVAAPLVHVFLFAYKLLLI